MTSTFPILHDAFMFDVQVLGAGEGNALLSPPILTSTLIRRLVHLRSSPCRMVLYVHRLKECFFSSFAEFDRSKRGCWFYNEFFLSRFSFFPPKWRWTLCLHSICSQLIGMYVFTFRKNIPFESIALLEASDKRCWYEVLRTLNV